MASQLNYVIFTERFHNEIIESFISETEKAECMLRWALYKAHEVS